MDFTKERLKALEDTVDDLIKENNHLKTAQEDMVTALAALTEMIRQIDYDMHGETLKFPRLGKFSFAVESVEEQQLPLKLSVVKINKNTIRIDFLNGENIESTEEHN